MDLRRWVMDVFIEQIKMAKPGDEIRLSHTRYNPQIVFAVLRQMGYSDGNPMPLSVGSCVTTFSKTGAYDINVYSNALTFELSLRFHEPCKYWL